MTNEEKTAKRKELERLYRKCPDIVSPSLAAKWAPFGKNRIYELIHLGELRAFNYRSHYIIAKDDLIEYLLDHCDEPSPHMIVNQLVAKRRDKQDDE